MNEVKNNIVEVDATQLGKAIIQLYDDYAKLKHQLKAYKDKEDRLREYLRSYYFEDNFVSIGVMKCCRNEIEEILNEGDK